MIYTIKKKKKKKKESKIIVFFLSEIYIRPKNVNVVSI